MNLLLDTHSFLWFINGDAQLSTRARSSIEDSQNQSLLSTASVWEMAIKVSLGKLSLGQPLDVLVPQQLATNGFQLMPISLPHTFAVATMPFHHRDPFDRLLIAQALTEQIPLVGADTIFDLYGVNRIW